MTETVMSAVLYGAKSTTDHAGSIGTQLDDCRAMAEREGRNVVSEFSDEAASAYHGNRGEGLQSAMDLAARLARE